MEAFIFGTIKRLVPARAAVLAHSCSATISIPWIAGMKWTLKAKVAKLYSEWCGNAKLTTRSLESREEVHEPTVSW